jgi:uncharacterized SAM-binding protein YcdF (DUF218 family)
MLILVTNNYHAYSSLLECWQLRMYPRFEGVSYRHLQELHFVATYNLARSYTAGDSNHISVATEFKKENFVK